MPPRRREFMFIVCTWHLSQVVWLLLSINFQVEKQRTTAAICDSVDHLAEVYAKFYDESFQECRQNLIDSISNTMSDRVTSNHAAICLVNSSWHKVLNELNCHLHPLDTIASTDIRRTRNRKVVWQRLFCIQYSARNEQITLQRRERWSCGVQNILV